VLAWVVAGIGLLVALVALAMARRLSRRLDVLTQSYWDLRYEYTRLRSQVSRLEPETVEAEPAAPPAAPVSVSFVPLSTIKKKDR
jgi:acyl carrier protein phosphodiesterase